MSDLQADLAVAEIQGIYGPFTFSEKLLQKIWAQGDFDRSQLCSTDGISVEIISPGKWNLLAGPDFKHARLRLGGGEELVGDVELHLRAEDWAAHAHANDPAYGGVKLHVVLFPPRPDILTKHGDGRAIPILALLPWLHHDLEEYAADEAVAKLSNRTESQTLELMRQISGADVARQLHHHAAERWRQKVRFARLRLEKSGWTQACHQTAMEVLGYRYNRVPMLNLAIRHELSRWPSLAVDQLLAEESDHWSRSGVRPANAPRTRLRQYHTWTRSVSDWPQRWLAMAAELPQLGITDSTRGVRRNHQYAHWRSRIAVAVCGGGVGGPRLDTMICDALLPLLAARTDMDLAGLWYHWYLGDVPRKLVTALRQVNGPVMAGEPICHGIVQGLIGWILARERHGVTVGS